MACGGLGVIRLLHSFCTLHVAWHCAILSSKTTAPPTSSNPRAPLFSPQGYCRTAHIPSFHLETIMATKSPPSVEPLMNRYTRGGVAVEWRSNENKNIFIGDENVGRGNVFLAKKCFQGIQHNYGRGDWGKRFRRLPCCHQATRDDSCDNDNGGSDDNNDVNDDWRDNDDDDNHRCDNDAANNGATYDNEGDNEATADPLFKEGSKCSVFLGNKNIACGNVFGKDENFQGIQYNWPSQERKRPRAEASGEKGRGSKGGKGGKGGKGTKLANQSADSPPVKRRKGE